MKSKYHHHLLLILAISVAVVVMALYAYLYYAVIHSASRAIQARDLAGIEQLNKDQEKNLTNLYEETRSDRLKLQSLFVHTDDIVSFIEAIEALESQTGGKITISSIGADELDEQPLGTIGKIGAQVEARGSWAAVMKTLSAVELLPYHIVVNDIRFDTSNISPTNKNREWRLVFDVQAALIEVPIEKN